MALELHSNTSFDASGNARARPTWSEPTAVVYDTPGGNIDGAAITITDTYDGFPTISVSPDSNSFLGTSGWRHFHFGVSGVEGKNPNFIMTRADSDSIVIHTDWRAVRTQDFDSWEQSANMNLVGGSGGTLEWNFPTPFSAGSNFVSSTPRGHQAEADALATLLLNTHSSVASPSTSADVNGVYRVTQASTNHNGVSLAGLNQYAITLDWGGSTTDGAPKRKMVMSAMIHAGGEGQQWFSFTEAVDWMLNDVSTEASNFRSNWVVNLYFNCNAAGVEGGSSRRTYDEPTTSLNRVWRTPPAIPPVPETADLQAAIITDTGTSANIMINWHGDVYSSERFGFWTDPLDQSSPLATYTAVKAELDTLFSPDVANIGSLAVPNDVWFGRNILGCTAFDVELPSLRSGDKAFFQDVGNIWVRAVSIADQTGVFNTTTLSVANMTHSHTAENISLTQANTLTVNDVTHSHAIDNVVLTTAINLVINDSLHGQSMDNIVLTQANTLVVDPVNHSHALDAVALTQANTLAVNELLHSHAIDNVELSTAINLVIANIVHSHLIDNPLLTQANTLTVDEILHSHALDNVSLTQANILSVDELNHSNALDNVTLNTGVNLSVNDILHGHALDGVALTQSHVLAVQELLHGHVIDGDLTLLTDLILSVGSITHAHTLENVSWAVLITPDSRIYLVEAENRIYSVQ